MSLFLLKLQRREIFYPAAMQQKIDGAVCEPRKEWGPTCGPALLGGARAAYGLCSRWCETRNTHTVEYNRNNRWMTCSPRGFVSASAWAAHCYGAISLMGLVSVRQRAKIIIFQGLNFIPWQQLHRQEGTVATTYCITRIWGGGDIVDFNANQTPMKQLLTYLLLANL